MEFIPITDKKVKQLIKGKSLNLIDYNEDYFIKALSRWFLIKEAISLKDSGRRLFLLEKENKNNSY